MGDIRIGRIVLGMYQTNCYFAYREDSKDVCVFDPADSGDYIFKELTDRGFCVKAILLTHGHFDHIYGANELRKLAGCKIYAGKDEKELLNNSKLNCSASVGRIETVEADEYLSDGDKLSVAGMDISVLFTPGHTKGSVCYLFENEGILIAGDTLFNQSVGRSDLPTGNGRTLIDSIRKKIMVLPNETVVYPGHGEKTRVLFERENNPYL